MYTHTLEREREKPWLYTLQALGYFFFSSSGGSGESPVSYFGVDQVVGPFEVEDAQYGMEWEGYGKEIVFGPVLFGSLLPHAVELEPQEWIEVAPDKDPGGVKENGDEFDLEGKEGRQVNDPGRKTLLVKDPSGNEEPCVDLDAHAGTHTPLGFLGKVGDHNVHQSSQVVL